MNYYVSGIISQIEALLQQDDVKRDLHHFIDRRKYMKEGILEDIYDGKVFKEFCGTAKLGSGGQTFWFEAGSYDLALQINADGFQAFKKTSYSVTPIFLTILNFPRETRYDLSRMILGGLISGNIIKRP